VAVDRMLGFFRDVGTAIAAAMRALFDTLDGLLGGRLSSMVNGARAVLDLFLGAWRTLSDTVANLIGGMFNILDNLFGGRLSAIADAAKAKLDAITGFFKNMYDKVAGNSYVPDMMDVVDYELGDRLEEVVVDAHASLDSATGGFADMSESAIGSMEAVGGATNKMNMTVGEAARNMLSTLQNELGATGLGSVMDKARGFLNSIGVDFSGPGGVVEKILKGASDILGGLRENLVVKFRTVVSDFVRLWNSIKSLVDKFVDAVNSQSFNRFGGINNPAGWQLPSTSPLGNPMGGQPPVGISFDIAPLLELGEAANIELFEINTGIMDLHGTLSGFHRDWLKRVPGSDGAGGVVAGTAAGGASNTVTFSFGDVNIHTSGDGEETYREFYNVLQDKARAASDEVRAFVQMLPAPS
jgi:hypothetical protein